MFYAFITLPTPANLIASTTTWSSDFFQELWGPIAAIAGIGLGILFVKYLVGKLSGGMKGLLRGRRGRRGRRR